MVEGREGPISAALFERCRKGEVEAFTEVYGRMSRPLFGTALRMLGDRAEAEDVMQEAFLSFYRRASGLEPGSASGWLRRVLVNLCIDRTRQRGRRPSTELEAVPEGVLSTPARDGARALDLEAAVARLPERARLVFLLHDVEGYRHRDIAETLGISDGTSKAQLFRARALLRELLTARSEEAS